MDGHATTLSYSGSQIVITDAGGRSITLALSGGRILSATLNSSPVLSVGYGYTSGDLTSVTDMDGGITSFAYDSANQMTEMRSPRFYAAGSMPAAPTSCSATPPANMVANYYDPTTGLVDCQWDPDGRKTTFQYNSASGLAADQTSTLVTDPKGNETLDIFTAGLLTSETRASGTTQAATWTYMYDPISGGVSEIIDPSESVYGGNADVSNQVTQFFYDTNGNMLTEIDPLGRVTTSTYNIYNQITSVTPPILYGSTAATTTYSYDEPAYSTGGAGNLTTVSTPILSQTGASEGTQYTHYLYCANSTVPSACPTGVTPFEAGDVTAMIDPEGDTWNYAYDSDGDRISEMAPVTSDNSDGTGTYSATTKWAYNTSLGLVTAQLAPRYVLANPSATTCTTPAVGCTTYSYNFSASPTGSFSETTTDGDDNVTTTENDPDGNLSDSIDGDNNETLYTYDAAEQLTETTQGYGSSSPETSKTDYNLDGTIKDQIDADNDETQYAYDPLAHITSVTDPDNRITGFQYDALDNLLVRSDPGVTGCTTSSTTDGCTIYSYDADNEPIGINYNNPDVTPNITSEVYDLDGRRTSMIEQAPGSTTSTVTSTWSYDSLGRLTSTTDINGNTVSYGYDARSDLTCITYPNTSGLSCNTSPNAMSVTRAYDAAGRVSSIKDWLGNTTTYLYDADSNLTTQTAPTTGSPVVDTSTFDNADNLSSITAAQGSTGIDSFTYTYDGANQIHSVTSTGVPTDNHTYTYTPLQQLASDNTTSTYSYDPANNPIGLASQTSTNPTVQSFDPADQLKTSSQITLVGTASAKGSTTPTTVNLPAGTTTNDQILVAVTTDDGVTITTPTGYTKVEKVNTGTGSTNALTALYAKTATSSDTSVTVSLSAAAEYSINIAVYRGVNPTDPIDQKSDATKVSGTGVNVSGFTPTNPGEQLVYVAGALTSAKASWTFSTGFTAQTSEASTTIDQAIADEPLVGSATVGSQKAVSSQTGNLVGILTTLNPAQTTDTYDTRGDLTTITPPTGSPTTLSYNQARQLTSYASTTYGYNGDGLRMTKTTGSNTETFTWDQNAPTPQLLTDTNSTTTEDYIYDPNGLPLEQISGSGTVTWYHHDAQGSTRTLTNSSGVPIGTATYTSYGATQATTGTTTPLGYTGAYTDAESGLIYLINRYYDPTTGQFLSMDPLVDITQSAYGYVEDNPLNAIDPNGLGCGAFSFVCSAVGAVVHIDSVVVKATVDIAALAPYGVYYGSYEASKGINAVGSTFGGPGRDIAKVVAAPFAVPEGLGLAGDITIDFFKGVVFGDESIYDEGHQGYINPLHSFLPSWLRGPQIYLPGLYKNPCGRVRVDFSW